MRSDECLDRVCEDANQSSHHSSSHRNENRRRTAASCAHQVAGPGPAAGAVVERAVVESETGEIMNIAESAF